MTTILFVDTGAVAGPTYLANLFFLKDLGNRLRQATGDETPIPALLSVSLQRGNTASVLGTIGH